jgi:hypothetical protein
MGTSVSPCDKAADVKYPPSDGYVAAGGFPEFCPEGATALKASKDSSVGRTVCYMDVGRGLQSSTFRLNVSAYRGTGGAYRGCLGGV